MVTNTGLRLLPRHPRSRPLTQTLRPPARISRDKSPRGVNYTAWKQNGQSTRSATSQSQRLKYARSAGIAHSQHPFTNGKVNPDSVSKVVDENGEPLVVYHGTSEDFTAFDPKEDGGQQNAIWFTDNPDIANFHALKWTMRTGANVMPLFLRLTKPLVTNANGKLRDTALVNTAKQQERDGVIYQNANDAKAGNGTLFVAFDPTQIKSATANTGTYSSDNADIRYSFAPEQSDNQPTQTGRAQPLNAPVLTPDGWRPIGELTVGDIITSHQGTASTVTGVFPQGRKQVFKIILEDGRTVRATADHLWLALYDQRDGIMTTQHLINHIARGRTVKLPVMRHEMMVG
jgi:hypothetical protein